MHAKSTYFHAYAQRNFKGERKSQQTRASLNTKDITMTYYLLMMLQKFSRAACPFYLKAWFMFFPFKVPQPLHGFPGLRALKLMLSFGPT
jgi:hypothetical protein